MDKLDDFFCDETLGPIIVAIAKVRAQEGSEVPVEIHFPQLESDHTFEAEFVRFPVVLVLAGQASEGNYLDMTWEHLIGYPDARLQGTANTLDEFRRLRPQIEARARESIQRRIDDEEARIRRELEEAHRVGFR